MRIDSDKIVEWVKRNFSYKQRKNGAELTGGTIATGGAKADMQGYTLIFSTSEPEPYNTLSAAGKSAYSSLLVQGT